MNLKIIRPSLFPKRTCTLLCIPFPVYSPSTKGRGRKMIRHHYKNNGYAIIVFFTSF